MATTESSKDIWELANSKLDSIETRLFLFEHYAPWCKKIASSLFKRYGHPLLDWHDFVSISSCALLESIDRYDLDKEIPFEAFCYPYIKGKILNEIRAFSRSDCKTNIYAHLDLYAREREFEGDISFYSFEEFIEYTLDKAVSMFIQHGSYQADNQLEQYSKFRSIQLINELIEELDLTSKTVVTSYFYHYMSFEEIGQLLGISKSKAYQKYKSIISKLRKDYELLTTP